MTSLIHSVALFEKVDERIRERIFSHDLKPGERIDEQALARDFGISRTPLREALKVLHNEGLVKLVPRRGCFVAKLSERDVDEIYDMIGMLESACAARAAQAAPADLGRLRRATARMTQAAADRNFRRYFDANLAAHEAVKELGGNPWVNNVLHYLRSMCRLWPYNAVADIPGRLEQSLQEHEALFAAIEARDPVAAETIMRKHIDHTRAALKLLARRDRRA